MKRFPQPTRTNRAALPISLKLPKEVQISMPIPHNNPHRNIVNSAGKEFTQNCKFYTLGTCKMGNECTFIHSGSQSQQKKIIKLVKEGANGIIHVVGRDGDVGSGGKKIIKLAATAHGTNTATGAASGSGGGKGKSFGICRNIATFGYCKFESTSCKFSHPKQQCPDWNRDGYCSFGEKCRYLHEEYAEDQGSGYYDDDDEGQDKEEYYETEEYRQQHAEEGDDDEEEEVEEVVHVSAVEKGPVSIIKKSVERKKAVVPVVATGAFEEEEGNTIVGGGGVVPAKEVTGALSFSKALVSDSQRMANANAINAASLPINTVTSTAPTAISTPIMSRISEVAAVAGRINGGSDGDDVLRHDNDLIKAIQVRIQQDEECDLWSTEGFETSTKSPDILVMFREMALFGLDRNVEKDYGKYFEIKQKLEMLASTRDLLIRSEMEIMGLLGPGEELGKEEKEGWAYIREKMSRHIGVEGEWMRSEMPILGLKETSLLDRVEYFGIKAEIAFGGEGGDEEGLLEAGKESV